MTGRAMARSTRSGTLVETGDLEKMPTWLHHIFLFRIYGRFPTSECSAWVIVFCPSAFTM